ncbi:hypothetical protein SAMN04489740_4201 [Arthrobacter alpinus]|uniref:Alpha/beta hydrolase n=1 Tax=Arthrobacter alpinus TaxID=656366 RepID=A0A1H5PGF3_9MICC|nr:hypothetical protein [Arthrobacter alpinus]SEF12208.1 hypothetical protein SAMN04489740_4201 [Arthrobacter alpinus]
MSQRTAIVFGPVQPAWDNGEFFAPITERLRSQGFTVQLIDTVALVEATMTVEELAALWFTRLGHLEHVDLVCGNALGGAVAQAYATHMDASVPVLSVSGPGRSDQLLSQRLEEIADLANRGLIDEALALLHRRVSACNAKAAQQPNSPVIHPSTARVSARSEESSAANTAVSPASIHRGSTAPGTTGRRTAAQRLTLGLRMLCDLDLAEALSNYHGMITTVVGADSQLVTARHVVPAPRSETFVFDRAGMRPHHDRPEILDSVVATLIKELETV